MTSDDFSRPARLRLAAVSGRRMVFCVEGDRGETPSHLGSLALLAFAASLA